MDANRVQEEDGMKTRIVAFAAFLALTLTGVLGAQTNEATYSGTIVSVSPTSLVIKLADGSEKTLVVDSTTIVPTLAIVGTRVTVRYRPLDAGRFQATTVSILEAGQTMPPVPDPQRTALPNTASNQSLLWLAGLTALGGAAFLRARRTA
jgi:hypothetical protein